MVEELLDQKSSQDIETMMDVYKGIETDGGKKNCEGNISHQCVQESINQIGEALTDYDEWVLGGGIPVQIAYLQEKGQDSDVLMREFGNRITSDVDIITTEPAEVRSKFNNSEYNQSELLDVDIVDESVIDETDKIVQNGEWQYVGGYGELDTEIRMPTPADLLYTKIQDGYHKESTGTAHDLNSMRQSGVLNIDENRLYELAKNNNEAMNYIEELGF